MRYTETISIQWHTLKGEKPAPNRSIIIKHTGSNVLWQHCEYIAAKNVSEEIKDYDEFHEWAYVDEIKSVQSDGKILSDKDDLLTQDNVSYFAIVSVSCELFYDEEPYENVIAEVVMKDGTKIPFDVPVFKDALKACHPHTLFYKGNRYIIDIMPNDDDKTHKEKYRGVIRRCNGPEHPIFVYGNILTFC